MTRNERGSVELDLWAIAIAAILITYAVIGYLRGEHDKDRRLDACKLEDRPVAACLRSFDR